MGLWTSATLNRYIKIGAGDDDQDIYDYQEKIEKDFIEDSNVIKLTEKYGVYLTTRIVDDYQNILFIIHNKDSEVSSHFFADGFFDLPEVKDDETFFQRTEDFIKDFIVLFPHLNSIAFSPVGKRLTAVS